MKRLHFVDSLRGLAAVYVVLFHTALVPRPYLELPIVIEPLVLFGGTGVFLFFLISGFSLSLTAPLHAASGAPLFSYLTSRLFRIAPLFYAFLLVNIIYEALILGEPLWPRNVVFNFLFLFNFMPGRQEGIVAASWTIGVEMIYYAIFAFTRLLPVTWKLAILVAAIAVFAAMQADPSFTKLVYFSFIGFLPMFLMGELAFYVYERIQHQKPWPLAPLLLLAGAIALAFAIYVIDPKRLIVFRLVTGMGYAFVILGLGLMPFRLIVNRATTFLGKISYSIYLCHPPVIIVMEPWFRQLYRVVPTPWAYIACAASSLAITIPLGWLLFHVVERPGIRLGRALVTSRTRAVAVVSS